MAVPLSAVTVIAQSPVEGLVRDCDDVGEEGITVPGGWSGPEVAKTPLDCVDECTAWDNGYQCETIDGMTVYYGGDLCDLDESDWDDPYDIASAEYVDQYNFDVRMDLVVVERCRGPYGSEMLEDEGTGLAHVCQTTLSHPQGELDTVDIDPLADVFEEKLSVTAAAVSPMFGVAAEVMIKYKYIYKISEIRMIGQSRIVKGILGWTGVILHFGMELVHFLRMQMIRSRWLCLMTNCFQMTFWPIRLSIHEEVPVLTLKFFCTDEGVPLVPPVIDQGVRRIKDELISQDKQMDV